MTRIGIVRRLSWLLCLSLAGCVATAPPRDQSTLNRANTELRQAVEDSKQKQQVPAAVNAALLPPLRVTMPKAGAKQLEQRFDLVVTDAPVSQVFNGIVSGTRYSILVPPEASGTISLNLKDVTVFDALDAIREMYGYDYRLEGSRIHIQSLGLQTKIYRVNYITGLRTGQTDIRVTGSTGSGSNAASASGSSSQTSSKADVWKEIEDTIRTILECKIPGTTEVQTTTVTPPQGGTVNIPTLIPGETKRERGVGGCVEGKGVIINHMSGTILVKGSPADLRTIEKVLRAMQVSIDRQVIIEAKIIDVDLNSTSQQGINWAGFQTGGTQLGTSGTKLSAGSNAGGSVVNGASSVAGAFLGKGLAATIGSL